MTMTSRERSTTMDQWTPEEEICLFFAMGCLKPVGVNKHFYMATIVERLSNSLNRDFTSENIWGHLRTLYNFKALDEMEPLPFPNDEKEFSLPEAEFSSLLKKIKDSEENRHDIIEGPPSIIAVATDNTNKDKLIVQPKMGSTNNATPKESDKKITVKLSDGGPKRTPKRTRGSVSLESNSPSTTPPPPVHSNKRRRI